MPVPTRRYGDPNPEDSFLRRASKSKSVDLALRAVAVSVIGLGSGYASHFQKGTELEDVKTELQRVENDAKDFRKLYWDQVRKAREQHDAELLQARDRLMALETEVRLLRERHE